MSVSTPHRPTSYTSLIITSPLTLVTTSFEPAMSTAFPSVCPMCGALTSEGHYSVFPVMFSEERRVSLLCTLKHIAHYITQCQWVTPYIGKVLTALDTYITIPTQRALYASENDRTIFASVCPLCDTPAGWRAPTANFVEWVSFPRVERFQAQQLFYEIAALIVRDAANKTLWSLINNIVKALDAIDDFHCPLCGDKKQPSEPACNICRYPDDEDPLSPNVTFAYFLRKLVKNDLLGIGPNNWDTICFAAQRDYEETINGTAGFLSLVAITHPINEWLEPWRQMLQSCNCSPGRWDNKVLFDPPTGPSNKADAWRSCRDLPRAAHEYLGFPYARSLPRLVERVFFRRGLLKYGDASDPEGYLSRLSRPKLRDIASALNAGKGSSNVTLVRKILAAAGPDNLDKIFPEKHFRWIEDFSIPTWSFPENWMQYARYAALCFQDFIWKKYESWLAIKGSSRRVGLYVEKHIDCPPYCEQHAGKLISRRTLDAGAVPPWFPGCSCIVKRVLLQDLEESPLEHLRVDHELTVKRYDGDMDADAYIYSSPGGVDLRGLTFKYAESASKKNVVLIRSGQSATKRELRGWYFLLRNQKVALIGRLGYPIRAAVADTGRFVVVEQTAGMGNKHHAAIIDSTGAVHRSEYLSWEPLSVAISGDGNFVAFLGPRVWKESRMRSKLWESDAHFREGVATCFQEIILVDTRHEVPVRSITVKESLWRQNVFCRISVNAEKRVLCLSNDHVGIVECTFDGCLLDEKRFLEAQAEILARTLPKGRLVWEVRDILGRIWGEEARKVCLVLLLRLLDEGISEEYVAWRAYSLAAALLEEMGSDAEALKMYETARERCPLSQTGTTARREIQDSIDLIKLRLGVDWGKIEEKLSQLSFDLPRNGKLEKAAAIGERCGALWFEENENTLPSRAPAQLDTWSNACERAWWKGVERGWQEARKRAAANKGETK